LVLAAFRLGPDAALIVRDDGQYLHGNRAACELLEVNLEELRGHRFGDFSRGAMRLRTREWWEQLRRGRLAIRHVVTAADGDEHVVETRGRSHVAPGVHVLVARTVESRPQDSVLSPREREVLELLACGNSTQEAAGHLYLSPLTVRTHLRNAMEKLGARSRAHAVATALRVGELSD
jgi:DNA-binding CsgD family transcriptional regulator